MWTAGCPVAEAGGGGEHRVVEPHPVREAVKVPVTVPAAPAALHVMAKPAGAICNLDCEYCFFLDDTLPGYCRRCAVRFACNGGCPKDRFCTTPDGEGGLHYLCAGYKRFFGHIDEPMRVMAGLLRQGADATGIRGWYATRDGRRPRNSSCTCGSGRKWKQCHGALPPRRA